MPKKAGVSAKVCFEYLGKYPKMPDMTLAKLIYKENGFCLVVWSLGSGRWLEI